MLLETVDVNLVADHCVEDLVSWEECSEWAL